MKKFKFYKMNVILYYKTWLDFEAYDIIIYQLKYKISNFLNIKQNNCQNTNKIK